MIQVIGAAICVLIGSIVGMSLTCLMVVCGQETKKEEIMTDRKQTYTVNEKYPPTECDNDDWCESEELWNNLHQKQEREEQ